jgi:flagellar biosynthesis protein FlhG
VRLVEEKPFADEAPNAAPEILAVGGGKGGVGKTCFSVNIAVSIAQKGWRVVLLDADLSCSNIEAVLGARADQRLDDFFYQKDDKDLDSILCDTPYENLKFIPGTSGLLDVANPKFVQKKALIKELRGLKADVIIVDLAAGSDLNTLDFFLMSDSRGVLVITPERTSIDNAFKFLRAAVFRRIERFYQSPELSMLLKRNLSLREFIADFRGSDVFDAITRDRICGEMVALARSIMPRIVVNRAHNVYEAQIAANILAKYARHHLHIEPDTLGFMHFDKCVSEAVNLGKPFVVGHPNRPISECIGDIANRLGYL